jgi:prephenate dehydrogenase
MASAIPFRRVAIIGTGLIGGSFGLALRKQFPGVSLIGFDREAPLKQALARGAVQEVTTKIDDALLGADLVYVALPINAAVDVLLSIGRSIYPKALVTDACSTKTLICKATRHMLSGPALFLGGHPMAGKEQSGIDHADAELFRGAPYVLMGTEATADPRALQFAEIVGAIGARPVWSDPDTHDWAVGIVSHLPQIAAIALARVVQDETDETGLPLSLAGSGLQDSLRLAGSPYSVWRDILLTNTDNVSRALDRLAQAIDYLRTHLASKDLEAEFTGANELYKQLRKPS